MIYEIAVAEPARANDSQTSESGRLGVAVRDLQTVVVRWMDRQLARLDWRPERWAREAGLAPTTVTRAMSDNYNSVSSVPTLHALARAGGIPSVIDFLNGQATIAPQYPIITAMLKEFLPAVGVDLPDRSVQRLGEAIARAVAGMSVQPSEAADDPEVAEMVARAIKATMWDG